MPKHNNIVLEPLESRRIIKVKSPKKVEKKIIPEKLCVNKKTGNCEVTPEFFWQVWKEYSNDDSWNAWVCQDEAGNIHGVIVLQSFVHESEYFAWGPPLIKIAEKPNAQSGEIPNIAEISVFCAKGCGRLLLNELEEWVQASNYDAIVLSSTPGAIDWYKLNGYREVKAYRLEPNHSLRKSQFQAHRYRHRISDGTVDLQLDPPSVMLYKLIHKKKDRERKYSLASTAASLSSSTLDSPSISSPSSTSSTSSSSENLHTLSSKQELKIKNDLKIKIKGISKTKRKL